MSPLLHQQAISSAKITVACSIVYIKVYVISQLLVPVLQKSPAPAPLPVLPIPIIHNIIRHSRPIFKFWKNGHFICSIDRVLIAHLRNT